MNEDKNTDIQSTCTKIHGTEVNNKKHSRVTFIYDTPGGDGFIGQMIVGGIFTVIRGLILSYFIFYSICVVHQFGVFWSQEVEIIQEARERYELNCEGKSARQAVLFYSTCKDDKLNKEKCGIWEAIYRVARKRQLCGENGCGGAVYMVIGMVLGGLGLLFILPWLQTRCQYGTGDIGYMESKPVTSGWMKSLANAWTGDRKKSE